MKMWPVFLKSLREQLRDPLALSLTLIFAPLFVLLYSALFQGGSTSYGVLVLNQDERAAETTVVDMMKSVTYANGSPLLRVSLVASRAEGEARLRNRDAALLIIVPDGFMRAMEGIRAGRDAITTSITFVGDLTNPYYAVAAVMAGVPLDQYVQTATGRPRPVELREEPLGASAARSEFETYVPGLLVFAVIMLVFLAAMTVVHEVETGTLRRLQISRMTALDYLGGVSASLVVTGTLGVALTFLAAVALGFRSQGPLWVAILIGAVTSLSIVGVGLIVACFARTVTQAFLIANFPLGLFMFFSGAVFPMPRVPLFTLAGRTVSLYDILPPTHAVVALSKVMTMGAGFRDVAYELAALLILSAAFFAVGVWLFKRKHLSAR